MTDKNRLENFTELLTTGLKDDTELRRGFTNVETELVKRMRKDYEEIFRRTGL